MQFSVGGNENAATYAKEADNYPSIRLFTVGQKTTSYSQKLMNLQTIEQKWIGASAKTVTDGSPFNYFSAVCWFFGKGVYDGLGGKVPIGLVSNNWGGTRVEQWMSPSTSLPCGHASTGELYNAMIAPYTLGPMAVSGFTWYQGESDLGGKSDLPGQNNNYTCTQTAQITQWRSEFQIPNAFYAIVQLSTWHPDPILLAQLRDQQLATGELIPNFAYATNADYGAGGNIHPPYKQHPGARLANAALSIVYNQPINWRSPTYASAVATGAGEVTVWFNDVPDEGLVIKAPFNAQTEPDCAALNAKVPRTCAWAELQFNDAAKTWVNATVSIGAHNKTIILTVQEVPTGANEILASSYGWGSVPMMSVYRADMDGKDGQLPVLTWNRPITATATESKAVLV
jgi:sialate O-acetylesterase